MVVNELTVGNLQEVADSIDMIQMLLAGAIAKRTGYNGAIVGWERDSSGYLKVPEFWSWSDIEEAGARFVRWR